jgi:sialate O-acetylesterase
MLTCVLTVLAVCTLRGSAEIKPNGLFSHNAVLQQGMPVPVWGTAPDGEKVTVRFQKQSITTTAKDGRWLLRLKPLKAGGPFTMTISGESSVTLTNILVGEVWLCSGQSNMEFPLSRAANAQETIPASGDSQLRLFAVPRGASDEPRTDTGGLWKQSEPDSAKSFSAVAWFFGRALRRARGVPIGLIHSSVGGTPAEAWTARSVLEAEPELNQILERQAAAVRDFGAENAATRHKEALEKHKQAVADARAAGKEPPAAPRAPEDPARSSRRPCGLYNAMISPLEPYGLAGVIWYQGESNSGRAAEYRKLFPAMIQCWRQAWGQGDFPFLFVQIAPQKNMSPEIREAQLFSWQTVARTAMAVITDVGDEQDIHPTKKEPVGARLALAARAVAYGEKLEYSGPVYRSMTIEGNRAVLSFDHVGKGLVSRDGELKGFKICGADGQFVSAEARIDGKTVVVSNSSVARPVAVRFGWEHSPDVNLFNKEELPATPFRTDRK